MASPNAHSLLSPSGSHRWLVCTAAPRFEEHLAASTSIYAEEGTTAHKVAELYVQQRFCGMTKRKFNAELKKIQAEEHYDPEMLETAETYVQYLTERVNRFKHLHMVQPEMTVDLTRWIPDGFGQCDCSIIGDDTLHITDYKHGKGVPVSAKDNPQMRWYALGVLAWLDSPGGYYSQFPAAVYGKIKRVTMAIVQPRLADGISEDEISVDDLLAWGEWGSKQAHIAYEGKGEFVPGEHCKFCRGRDICRARAFHNLALEDFKDCVPPSAVQDGEPTDPNARKVLGLPNILSDAEIGDILIRGKNLVDWYKGVQEYALSCILEGGIIPGWKAVEGRSNRAFSDPDKAAAMLLDAGLSEEAVYKTEIRGLTELEKTVGKKRFGELLGDLIVKPRGKPTLAEESDKREAYNSAVSDFAEVGSGGGD